MLKVKYNKADLRDLQKNWGNFRSNLARNSGRMMSSVNNAEERSIESSPWRVGDFSGGVPVDTGDLRRDHRYETSPWESKVEVDNEYAEHVHGGTEHMEARPWLNWAREDTKGKREYEIKTLLDRTINNL